MNAGDFNDRARAAIYEAGWQRCVGCGRSDITAQHRRGRRMGGTSDLAIGHPANGVPLCGSGTTGCHGWIERHPAIAALLGYRLAPGEDALTSPWWHTSLGWRLWRVDPEDPAFVDHIYVDTDDLDRAAERGEALAEFERARVSVLPVSPKARG